MDIYYFLVDDPSDEIVIASMEADSPKEAFALLQPLYEPYSLLWLPEYTEPPLREKESPHGAGERRDEVSAVSGGAGAGECDRAVLDAVQESVSLPSVQDALLPRFEAVGAGDVVKRGTVMSLVLVKIDETGVRRYVPRFSGATPMTAEPLETAATTDLQQAQLFSAKPISLAGQTVLCLEPTPPPELEDWQAYAVSLWL